MGAGASTEGLPEKINAEAAKGFLNDKFDEAKFTELAGDAGEMSKEDFLKAVADAEPAAAEGVAEVRLDMLSRASDGLTEAFCETLLLHYSQAIVATLLETHASSAPLPLFFLLPLPSPPPPPFSLPTHCHIPTMYCNRPQQRPPRELMPPPLPRGGEFSIQSSFESFRSRSQN